MARAAEPPRADRARASCGSGGRARSPSCAPRRAWRSSARAVRRRPGWASPASWPTAWPGPGWRWSAGWRWASTPRPTPARSTAAGGTIAVLGCGIDRLYPRRNEALGEKVEAAGRGRLGVGPGRRARALAVPGTQPSDRGVGRCHAGGRGGDQLGFADHGRPRAGARPRGAGRARSGLDVARRGRQQAAARGRRAGHLGARRAGRAGDPRARAAALVEPPGGLPGRVWNELRGRPARPDMLALELGLGAAELAAALAELDLAGLLVTEPNGVLGAVSPS